MSPRLSVDGEQKAPESVDSPGVDHVSCLCILARNVMW